MAPFRCLDVKILDGIPNSIRFGSNEMIPVAQNARCQVGSSLKTFILKQSTG